MNAIRRSALFACLATAVLTVAAGELDPIIEDPTAAPEPVPTIEAKDPPKDERSSLQRAVAEALRLILDAVADNADKYEAGEPGYETGARLAANMGVLELPGELAQKDQDQRDEAEAAERARIEHEVDTGLAESRQARADAAAAIERIEKDLARMDQETEDRAVEAIAAAAVRGAAEAQANKAAEAKAERDRVEAQKAADRAAAKEKQEKAQERERAARKERERRERERVDLGNDPPSQGESSPAEGNDHDGHDSDGDGFDSDPSDAYA